MVRLSLKSVRAEERACGVCTLIKVIDCVFFGRASFDMANISIYQSKAYAMLNRSDMRHFGEVVRYLRPQEADKILEVGCGRGFMTSAVQEIAPETRGIDVNSEAIDLGVTSGLSVMAAERLRFSDGYFDKIFSFHTLEHIGDIPRVFQEMERVVRPGGKILLCYPAEPIRGLFSIPTAVAVFRNPFRSREIHRHRLFPGAIRKLIEHRNLEHVVSKFSFFSSPQFFTLLERT